MSKLGSKTIIGIKYLYLIVFFVLLAGFFYTIINSTSFDFVIIGVLILFVGLAGGVLVFQAATSDKRRGLRLGGGFTLIAISLAYILQITGRL